MPSPRPASAQRLNSSRSRLECVVSDMSGHFKRRVVILGRTYPATSRQSAEIECNCQERRTCLPPGYGENQANSSLESSSEGSSRVSPTEAAPIPKECEP